MSAAELLRSRVNVDAAGCWLWTGPVTPKGYGRVNFGGRIRATHRLAYEVFVGPIPTGLTLDHLCRVRNCINPEHLEPVTQRENSLRSPLTLNAINAAKTHCPENHPYDDENTYIIPSTGGRMCRACRAARTAARAAA